MTLVIHQLEEVPVAGKDAHLPAAVSGPVGQGAEHVIGFVARGHAKGQVEAAGQDSLEVAQVLEKVFWGHIPMGFIGLICLMAEGGLGRVKGDHQPLGLEALAVVE